MASTELVISLGMFLLGYILGTWTYCRASRQAWTVLPYTGPETKETTGVFGHSEETEAQLERLRKDYAPRDRVEGLGQW